MSEAEEQARALAGSHLVVEEDCWYSCPKSGECCNNLAGDICTCGYEKRVSDITAALQARERAGKQEGVRETWEAAAKKANDIALGADWAVEGCDGEEWVQFNTISREFTVFRNYCRQEAQEVGP